MLDAIPQVFLFQERNDRHRKRDLSLFPAAFSSRTPSRPPPFFPPSISPATNPPLWTSSCNSRVGTFDLYTSVFRIVRLQGSRSVEGHVSHPCSQLMSTSMTSESTDALTNATAAGVCLIDRPFFCYFTFLVPSPFPLDRVLASCSWTVF